LEKAIMSFAVTRARAARALSLTSYTTPIGKANYLGKSDYL
jgi:hypothetical protein